MREDSAPSATTRRGPRGRQPRVDGGAEQGLPPLFVTAARSWLGDEAAAFLAACTRPPHLAIRANELRGGLATLEPALRPDPASGTRVPCWPRVPWWPQALLPPADEAARLAGGMSARIGALYAQDPAALAAIAALDPRPGECVLDLCAAPGGKTTAIADRLGGQGLLVANDVDTRRARDLAHTVERWGAANAIVLAVDPREMADLAPGFFDRVLVDAPCSGEAMFARHARAAADWSPEHVAGSAARQRRLLALARRLVRPGGALVYATCTFNPQENEGVVAAHLAAHPHDTLEDVTTRVPGAAPGRPDLLPPHERGPRAAELTRCARLWPHRGPGAGHFVALIRAGDDPGSGTAPASNRPLRQAAADDMSDRAAVRACVESAAPGLPWQGRLTLRGDRAYLTPSDAPAQVAARALAPGVCVAERRGRTWRPAHALAMALHPTQARCAVDLDDAQAVTFLTGQPVGGTGAGEGLVLAAWHGYPLGWARARSGTLTPLLPSGLRRAMR